ncbi:MAG: CHASE domain-containing protein, partial [Bacillota bacterium]
MTIRPGAPSVAHLTLAIGVAATLLAWFMVGREVDRESRSEFENQAGLAAGLVERRVQRYIDLVYTVEALANHNPQFTHDEFHDFVTSLDVNRRIPGVHGLGFIRRVKDSERDAFIRSVRSDKARSSVPEYAAFDIKPPGRRPEYWVIDFIEPHENNRAAIGRDIRSRPEADDAASRARDISDPAMTPPFKLSTEAGSSFGMVIYNPVYAGADPLTIEGRHEMLKGFVNLSLRADDIFADILSEPIFGELKLDVFDVGLTRGPPLAPASNANRFYASPREAPHHSPFAWAQWQPSSDRTLAVAGRVWRLRFQAEPVPSPWLQPVALLTFFAGLLVTLLLYAILRTIARGRSEAIALAQRATRELRTQHEQLRAIIQAAPVAIVARDKDRVIRMWNPAAERMFGWKAAEVVDTDTSIVPDALSDETREMRERAEAGETIRIEETQRVHRDGHRLDVSLTISPVYDAQGSVTGTMVTIADITQRKSAERALRESEARLRLAMDAAQMGMWYWEAATDTFTYSEGLNVLFGRRPNDPHIDYRELQEFLHPQDREHFAATLRHAVKKGTDFQVDYRVVWPDGTTHWVANRAQVYRDAASGRALRVIGVAMD